jgi:hypothetical protein
LKGISGPVSEQDSTTREKNMGNRPLSLKKIISGGQTGADRAGLDVAIKLGLLHGGWVPKGRKAEDGMVPSCYQVKETNSLKYRDRTQLNVLDSDGTVIFSRGPLKGGSKLTEDFCIAHQKPYIHIDFDTMTKEEAKTLFTNWIEENSISVLNVAGPRESEDKDIYQMVKDFLLEALV